jgi:ABC-type proline/glycine betaine transport system permease subunit
MVEAAGIEPSAVRLTQLVIKEVEKEIWEIMKPSSKSWSDFDIS